MKLNQWIKVILIGTSALMLAGCHSMHKKRNDMAAIDDANQAYNSDGAYASGLGDERRFSENDANSNSSKQLASKGVYYFDFDSNTVRNDDKPYIEANAQKLANQPGKKVLLEGHTDPRGSREYNIGLGERRAKAVAELMAERGVKPSQVRVVSYGSQKLASAGHSESDYQQDRRAALINVSANEAPIARHAEPAPSASEEPDNSASDNNDDQ